MNSPKKAKKSIRVNLFDLDGADLPGGIEEDARKAVLAAFDAAGPGKSFQVSVILTSDKEIAALNKRYLEKDRPTDVLSFPYSTGKFVSADVFVSAGRAREQAAEYGHTFKQEILFLVLHGVLHLLGCNDRSDPDRKKMLRRQEEILSKLA
jgi:probable rRNA maturation factor